PFYFYPVVLLLLTLPRTAFFLDAFTGLRRWAWRSSHGSSRLLVFVLAWIVFPVLFFSFSGSKLPGYILPTLPAALIFIGLKIEERRRWPIISTGLFLLIVGIGGMFYGVRIARLTVACTALAAAPVIA